jgi:hypothetical protein
MKKCEKCGALNPDNNVRCDNCFAILPKGSTNHYLDLEDDRRASRSHQRTETDYFDPGNPIWLKIVLIMGIFVNVLLLIGTIIVWIIGEFPFGYVLLAFLIIFILHLAWMLSLNALYNLQQIRMNSDQQMALLKDFIKDHKIKKES